MNTKKVCSFKQSDEAQATNAGGLCQSVEFREDKAVLPDEQKLCIVEVEHGKNTKKVCSFRQSD